MTSATADREIVVSRVFDAPRELVFDAFTRPEHVDHWWGPNDWTVTTHEMDVRPGGVWRFTMHGPGGLQYPNRVDYVEIVPPERIVYDHSDEGSSESAFRTTVTLASEDGRTRVTMHAVFPTAAAREYVAREFHAVEGANQTLDNLGAYLKTL